jgi:4-diphosphocytidyl-2-C-methyl-D-erythritol kinase
MMMIMESVSLCDDIIIKTSPGEGKISVSTNKVFLPGGEKNIAGKAARVFYTSTGIAGYNTEITLKKRIPVCAGLGGGSSDGAAVLRGLNSLFNTKFTAAELEKLGTLVGSDVPYCVNGGTVLASGRGEILTKLKPMPKCDVVICKSDFSVSTPELFTRIDNIKIKQHPDTAGIIEAINAENLKEIAHRMHNVFEDALPKNRDKISDIKNTLIESGALGAVMSGTGSAVFGLFSDRLTAEKARNSLARKYADVFLSTSLSENLMDN